MNVLGVDVGAVSGIALLRMGVRDAVWLDGCSTREHPLDTPFFAGDVAFDVLGIECIEGYAHGERAHAKTKHLIAAAALAGEILGWARAKGIPVFSAPASVWRKRVLGKASPTDAEVKKIITLLVSNLPKRCSSHVRDACVAGIGAARAHRLEPVARRSAS